MTRPCRAGETLWSRSAHWLLALLVLLVSGCGDSNNDFVVTGNNNNPGATTGTLTFDFVKAQTPLTVPDTTTEIRFRFFTSTDGTGTPVTTVVRDFAPRISITGVSTSVRSVEVTAIGPNDVPLVEAVVAVNVVAGGEVVVSFANADISNVTLDTLVVTPNNASIDVGETQQFTASANYSNGDSINAVGAQFSVTGPATINANTGIATGTGVGNAIVTATLNGESDSASLEVGGGETPVLTNLTISPDNASLVEGATLQYTVAGVDQFGQPIAVSGVDWDVASGTGTATIDATGLLTAGTDGTVTVSATVGAVSDTTGLTVLTIPEALTGITITTPAPLQLEFGGANGVLTTTGQFANSPDQVLDAADGLTYESLDENVVTIVDGEIVPVGVGTTTVQAAMGMAFTDDIEVVVGFSGGVNSGPDVFANGTEFNLQRGGATASVFDLSTITDEQAYLNGGTLTIAVTNGSADLEIYAPVGAPGTITGDGSSLLTVTFPNDNTVTVAEVQALLRGVTVGASATSAYQGRTLTVSLTDGEGGSDSDSIFVTVQGLGALTLTVGPAVDDDFSTIQAAIDEVAANGGPYSVIVVANGNYLPEGVLVIADEPNLEGLRIFGNANLFSAGPEPALPRGAATIVDSFTVQAPGVLLSSLDFPAITNTAGVLLTPTADDFDLFNGVFSGTGTEIGVGNVLGAGPDRVDILGNSFSGLQYAVYAGGVTGALQEGLVIAGNAFRTNDFTVVLAYVEGSTSALYGNAFFNSQTHLNVTNDAGEVFLAFDNDFIGTGQVQAFTDGTVNAGFNYWGQATGPAVGQTATTGAAVVDVSEGFATEPFFPGFP